MQQLVCKSHVNYLFLGMASSSRHRCWGCLTNSPMCVPCKVENYEIVSSAVASTACWRDSLVLEYNLIIRSQLELGEVCKAQEQVVISVDIW